MIVGGSHHQMIGRLASWSIDSLQNVVVKERQTRPGRSIVVWCLRNTASFDRRGFGALSPCWRPRELLKATEQGA